MAQFIFVWPILFFRGDSLSRRQLMYFCNKNGLYFSKLWLHFFQVIFPHIFSFAPGGYVLTKKWKCSENMLRQFAQLFEF